jgi:hypothetical protein
VRETFPLLSPLFLWQNQSRPLEWFARFETLDGSFSSANTIAAFSTAASPVGGIKGRDRKKGGTEQNLRRFERHIADGAFSNSENRSL